MEQIRQGDILLLAVDKYPPKEVVPRKSVILAVGEMTGHAHTLTAPEIFDWQEAEQRYVRVVGGAGILHHKDHDPIPVKVLLPDTTYRVIPQREWDLTGQWQQVKD